MSKQHRKLDPSSRPRSFERLSKADLRYLANVAEKDLIGFIQRHPKHASLLDRRLAVLLCQGAALHYLDGKNGVKDFDVWTFFRAAPNSPAYPPRRPAQERFERTSFQDSSRWIDLLGRSIPVDQREAPLDAVRRYVMTNRNSTPRRLRDKAGVALWPPDHLGEVVWAPD